MSSRVWRGTTHLHPKDAACAVHISIAQGRFVLTHGLEFVSHAAKGNEMVDKPRLQTSGSEPSLSLPDSIQTQ